MTEKKPPIKKKSTAKKSKTAEVIEDQVQQVEDIQPEVMKLTMEEILKLRAYQAEVKSSELTLQMTQIQRDSLIRQLDPEGKIFHFDKMITASKKDHNDAARNYSVVRSAIENKLGIDLSKFSYDEVTGVLHEFGTEPKEEQKTEMN